MVILRNELEDMKTESLLKYELQLKMFSRGKNRDTELKRPDYYSFGRKTWEKSQVLHRLGWLSWCSKGARCYTATLQRDSGGVNGQTELSMKARSQKLKAGSHPFLDPLGEHTLHLSSSLIILEHDRYTISFFPDVLFIIFAILNIQLCLS